MSLFQNDHLTLEEAFWVMYYFLQAHYELSEGTFEVSDILSACEPIGYNEKGYANFDNPGDGIMAPTDSGMVVFWNESIEKYRTEGPPPHKTFTK